MQFPIGPLSLESYIERRVSHGKLLSLGKWWGEKPFVLTRALIIGAVFPAAEDPERWPEDLEIFLRCMCLENAGMWKRKTERLPADLCLEQATEDERLDFFDEAGKWLRETRENARTAADRAGLQVDDPDLMGWWKSRRTELERRVYYTLTHAEQRPYCCRVDEIDGPPEGSWLEINAYLGTNASTLPELIEHFTVRGYGKRLKVGDAFSGTGAIPFCAAQLGCDVFASDPNPVSSLLTWGALNLIGEDEVLRDQVSVAQERVYSEVNDWILENGYEASEEGWRADIYFYCIEVAVPEWDGWSIPVAPSWIIVPKSKVWIELVPIEEERRFAFRVKELSAFVPERTGESP